MPTRRQRIVCQPMGDDRCSPWSTQRRPFTSFATHDTIRPSTIRRAMLDIDHLNPRSTTVLALSGQSFPLVDQPTMLTVDRDIAHRCYRHHRHRSFRFGDRLWMVQPSTKIRQEPGALPGGPRSREHFPTRAKYDGDGGPRGPFVLCDWDVLPTSTSDRYRAFVRWQSLHVVFQ